MSPYPSQDRAQHHQIGAELAATHLSFHRLLAYVPQDALEAPTSNPAWNVRALLCHMILAYEMLPQDVQMIRRGISVPFSVGLFNVVNRFYTRWRARRETHASLARRFDLAHQNVLALLSRLTKDDLSLSADYPVLNSQMPGGRMTITDLYGYLSLHFAEHAVDVVRGVEQWRQQPAFTQVGSGKPPTGWRRILFRLPIWFYQNGLGWLMGGRFLLLHHVGRKSGLPRQTVVEVTDHDAAQDVYTIASGWGEQADWYKNLRAHPQTTIQVGRRRMAVESHFLSPQESGEAMVHYAHRYPLLAQELARLVGYRINRGDEGYRMLGQQVVRFVRLTPNPAPSR